MLNLLVNFMVSCNFYNFNWVQIDMNHTFPHSFMMLPLPRFIYTFQKKGGHESLQIIHQDNYFFFLEMTTVNMRITWIS